MVVLIFVASAAAGYALSTAPSCRMGMARSPVMVADATVAAMDPQSLGAAAVGLAVVGGGFYAYTQKDAAPPSPTPKTAGKPVKATKEWPMVGGTGGPHFMAGPWAPPPKRELWTPPPGWEPPKKPVTSWYDRGDRLTPAAPPAAAPPAPAPAPAPPKKTGNFFTDFFAQFQEATSSAPAATAATSPANKKWPSLGGSGGPHFMAGPWPKAPTRELWKPPPGWEPPSKPTPPVSTVSSWYDAGQRL